MTVKDLAIMEKPHLQGYIVLGWDEAAKRYVGYVENSFSMSISADRTQFLWSGTAHGNFGGKFELDGAARADRTLYGSDSFKGLIKEYPEYQWEAYDVHSPGIPVHLDWDEWREGSAHSDRTLSGVVNKYVARNPRFEMRETITGGRL